MNNIFECGCGGKKVSEEEIERVLREVENQPIVIPIRKTDAEPEAIPVENWPVRKEEEVTVR